MSGYLDNSGWEDVLSGSARMIPAFYEEADAYLLERRRQDGLGDGTVLGAGHGPAMPAAGDVGVHCGARVPRGAVPGGIIGEDWGSRETCVHHDPPKSPESPKSPGKSGCLALVSQRRRRMGLTGLVRCPAPASDRWRNVRKADTPVFQPLTQLLSGGMPRRTGVCPADWPDGAAAGAAAAASQASPARVRRTDSGAASDSR